MTNVFACLEKLINEHGSSVIQGKHLALIKDTLSKVEKENADLKRALSTVKEENERLKEEIEHLKTQIPSKEFEAYKGAKFKRKPSGGFEETVYCPKCEYGMTSLGSLPFTCIHCNVATNFHKKQLPKILKELEKEFPSKG